MDRARIAIKSVVRAASSRSYHTRHKIQALKVLRSTEQDNGTTIKETAKRCREYAIEVLGSKNYMPWLLVYSNVSGGFKEGWIPDNFYGAHVVPRVNGWYGQASGHKPLNRAILGAGEEIPDIGYYVNGTFLDREYRVLHRGSLKDLLFREARRVVFKTVCFGQGEGVHFFERGAFDPGNITALGNGVFQPWIKQHDSLEQFSRGSVATLRLTTTIDESGEVSCHSAYLRFGRSGETHVQSSTHIRVPVDPVSGTFDEIGYLDSWRKTSEHPDSNAVFQGFKMPSYDRCLETAKRYHERVPYVRCIGWDLAVDENGKPKIMEWNGGHNDIKFSEATQGPCFQGLGWENLNPRLRSFQGRKRASGAGFPVERTTRS